MAYRPSRKHRKIGWPEFWLVCLFAATVTPATIWWQQHYKPAWQKTGGVVRSWEISKMHYNALDYRTKAKVEYEYLVGVVKYVGQFEGFWPEVGTPNAVTPAELQAASQIGKELVVYYDPNHPERSQPFQEDTGPGLIWMILSAAGLACTIFYTFAVYPHLRA